MRPAPVNLTPLASEWGTLRAQPFWPDVSADPDLRDREGWIDYPPMLPQIAEHHRAHGGMWLFHRRDEVRTLPVRLTPFGMDVFVEVESRLGVRRRHSMLVGTEQGRMVEDLLPTWSRPGWIFRPVSQLRAPVPPPLPPDNEDDGSGRFLTILLVAAVVIAGLYLAFGRPERAPSPSDLEAIAAEERAARTWADKLGLRIAGVACTGVGRCTVRPEVGAPIEVRCAASGCVLARCD